jgi:hypothetical protein
MNLYTVLFFMMVFAVLAYSFVIWALKRAPEGYEDKDGFHLGKLPKI